MLIDNIEVTTQSSRVRLSARFNWEQRVRDPFTLMLETTNAPTMTEDQAGNALLATAFPIAFHDREQRLAIDGTVCPMLADNMLTVLDCWNTWQPRDRRAIEIETRKAQPPRVTRQRAAGFMSGGVDSFHMLQRNLKLYSDGSPAAIEQLILVHGFDIGKRARDAEDTLFAATAERLAAVCDRSGIRLATCRTNLRHIKLDAGFWTDRFYGAAVLGTGHAMVPGAAYLMLAGTYDFANLGPIGSNPAIDVQFSSQRVQVMHEGLRFTRQQKIAELCDWPDAIDNLRVCAYPGRADYNCGTCEKCVRTRLGLLGAGCRHSAAFGNHDMDVKHLDAIELDTGYQVACYTEIAAALQREGHVVLARGIRDRLAARPKVPGVTHART